MIHGTVSAHDTVPVSAHGRALAHLRTWREAPYYNNPRHEARSAQCLGLGYHTKQRLKGATKRLASASRAFQAPVFGGLCPPGASPFGLRAWGYYSMALRATAGQIKRGASRPRQQDIRRSKLCVQHNKSHKSTVSVLRTGTKEL